MRILNSIVGTKTRLSAEIVNAPQSNDGVKRQKVNAYSGNKVDLSDYGFDAPVIYNIETMQVPDKVPYLNGHMSFFPLGHAEGIKKINNQSVEGGVVYSYPSSDSKDIATAIDNGMPYQASIGLSLPETGKITYYENGEHVVNGRTFSGPIYVIDNARLDEISATLFGRDSDTSVTKLSKDDLMKIKNQSPATPGGKPDNNNDPPQDPPKQVNNNNPAPADPAPAPADPPADPPAPIQNANPPNQLGGSPVTASGLFRLQNTCKDEAEYKLVEEGLDNGYDEKRIMETIQLHRDNNDQPRPPFPGVGRGEPQQKHLLARVGLALNIQPEFIEQKLGKETAGRAFDEGPVSLREMITTVANANGGNFNGFSDIEQACHHLKTLKNSNQFSTINFPNLLHTVTQYRMEEHWGFGEPWAPQHFLAQSQSNFKDTGRIRPSGGQMWSELDEDGRIQHGKAGDEKTYKTSLKTIAQMLTFKRTDIINDDLGVIEETLALMVEGATMVPDKLFVDKLYGGIGSFLKTSKNNVLFGATDATFNEANLRTAYNTVRRHKVWKDDKYVWSNFNTRWALVVPPALEEEAWNLIKQERIVSNTASNTKQGARNYWFGKLELLIFDQLDNASYNNKASDDVWGIIPMRKQLSPYSITYLNNQRRPTTEPVDLPADMLGFGIRGYWDLEVNEREEEATIWAFPSESDPDV